MMIRPKTCAIVLVACLFALEMFYDQKQQLSFFIYRDEGVSSVASKGANGTTSSTLQDTLASWRSLLNRENSTLKTTSEFWTLTSKTKRTGRKRFPLYHEVQVPGNISESDRAVMPSAYAKGTTITTAPWFTPKRICIKNICCATSVAISLKEDDTHLINALAGFELGDVHLAGMRVDASSKYHSRFLTKDLIPCLQPGTIIQVYARYPDVAEFFKNFHPNITVPYVLITSRYDDSPKIRHLVQFANELAEPGNVTGMIVHWFATNAWYRGPRPPVRKLDNSVEFQKRFTAFPLGLSPMRPLQAVYLTNYLKQRNYANPFSDKSRWINSVELRDATTIIDTMFVKFGINRYSKMNRQPAYDMACGPLLVRGNNSEETIFNVPRRDNVTCSDFSKKTEIHETYMAASTYLFGLSPFGIGKDCYRNYELLFLGVIPVVPADQLFGRVLRGFPYVELEKGWNYTQMELVELLQNYVASDKFQNGNFTGWERLFMRYHRRSFLDASGRTKDIVKDDNGNEYYQAWRVGPYQKDGLTPYG